MKGLKSKVMSSFIMLVIAVVMMTSASFAWYTISTKGEISEVKMVLSAATNLEIAKVTTGTETVEEVALGQTWADVDKTQKDPDTYWGSTVTSFKEGKIDIPVRVVDNQYKGVKYGTDGRPMAQLQELATEETVIQDGISNLQARLEPAGDLYYIAAVFNVWLRTNAPGGARVDAVYDTANVKFLIDGVETTLLSSADVQVCAKIGDQTMKEVSTAGTAVGSLQENTQTLVKVYVSISDANLTSDLIQKGLSVEGIQVTFSSDDVKGVDTVTK